MSACWQDASRKDISGIKKALIEAENSHCKHYKVGCIVVESRKNRVISTGYNGPIRGAAHCDENGCVKDKGGGCVGTHAEMNSVLNCLGAPLDYFEGATVYITFSPCPNCMKHLVQAGVARVVFVNNYQRRTSALEQDPEVQNALEIAKIRAIKVEQINPRTSKIKGIA